MSTSKLEIAESIIKALDNLSNQTMTLHQLTEKYHKWEIEIVLEHLRKFEDELKNG